MGKEDVSKRFIDQDNTIKMEKLVFLKSIANTLKTGMNILGVDTPEKTVSYTHLTLPTIYSV